MAKPPIGNDVVCYTSLSFARIGDVIPVLGERAIPRVKAPIAQVETPSPVDLVGVGASVPSAVVVRATPRNRSIGHLAELGCRL